MAAKPGDHLGVFVRGVVVDDSVDGLSGGDFSIHRV